MVKIFISYRRSDTAAIAGRIYDRLSARYGPASVFLDIDDIPPGVDFRLHISRTLERCNVVLAIIGRRWLGRKDGDIDRLHQADDPVRAELEAALRVNISLIPLLVDGADMPSALEVPESLRDLVFLNALRIDNSREFNVQVGRLIDFVDSPALLTKRTKRSRHADVEGVTRTATAPNGPDLYDRSAIAVLPFKNFSGNADQSHFSDGIADEVINELARWRLFPVIARNSTFALRGQAADLTRLGRRLGARYVVEGGFNQIGQRARISVRLVDAPTGIQLASERFDRPFAELSEVQDQIIEMIVG